MAGPCCYQNWHLVVSFFESQGLSTVSHTAVEERAPIARILQFPFVLHLFLDDAVLALSNASADAALSIFIDT